VPQGTVGPTPPRLTVLLPDSLPGRDSSTRIAFRLAYARWGRFSVQNVRPNGRGGDWRSPLSSSAPPASRGSAGGFLLPAKVEKSEVGHSDRAVLRSTPSSLRCARGWGMLNVVTRARSRFGCRDASQRDFSKGGGRAERDVLRAPRPESGSGSHGSTPFGLCRHPSRTRSSRELWGRRSIPGFTPRRSGRTNALERLRKSFDAHEGCGSRNGTGPGSPTVATACLSIPSAASVRRGRLDGPAHRSRGDAPSAFSVSTWSPSRPVRGSEPRPSSPPLRDGLRNKGRADDARLNRGRRCAFSRRSPSGWKARP